MANSNVASILAETLISPNELDRNMEAANVVDGLFAIARAIEHADLALDRLGFNTSDYGGQHAMGCVERLAYVLEKGQLEVHAIVERDGAL